MATKNNHPPDSADAPTPTAGVHQGRTIGVVVVVLVAVLPVLFSQGFNQWTSIPTDTPYAAATGYRIVALPADGNPAIKIDSIVLHNDRAMNIGRVDESNSLPAYAPTPGVLRVDYTNGTIMAGASPPELDNTCCFSEFTHSPDGQHVVWTGTEGPGWHMHFELAPDGTVTKTRIDQSSNNDWTGAAVAYLAGMLTFTSSTDTNETVVYANTFSEPEVFDEVVRVPSDDVFQNRHPGMTADAAAMDLFLAYTHGTGLNLLKYDVDGGQVVWELNDIVILPPPPDATFNYTQVAYDDGHVVILTWVGDDMGLWYAEDAGGTSPPTASQYMTFAVSPPGDHQGLSLDGRLATAIHPNPAGSGAVIYDVLFNEDSAVPPNVRETIDPTLTGSFFNLAPNETVRLSNPPDPGSAVVYDVSGNEIYVAAGNPISGTMTYGTVPKRIHFDGFESGGIFFWNP